MGIRSLKMLFLLTLIIICGCGQTPDINCYATIKGIIVYPGEGYPSDLVVVACDTITQRKYTTTKHEVSHKDNYFHYTLRVPEGTYFVYAETSDIVDSLGQPNKGKGYFTDYLRLKKYQTEGDSFIWHKPIPVKVQCKQIIKDITVGDFWN